jgi:hypothetical protein
VRERYCGLICIAILAISIVIGLILGLYVFDVHIATSLIISILFGISSILAVNKFIITGICNNSNCDGEIRCVNSELYVCVKCGIEYKYHYSQ